MGGELNYYPIPHIAPLRMVAHGFSQQGHPRHKTKGCIKITKCKLAL